LPELPEPLEPPEPLPAPTPETTGPEDFPPQQLPVHAPGQRRMTISPEEVENFKRQVEALEKLLREQNSAPEHDAPQP
jgi:hypothetical protein